MAMSRSLCHSQCFLFASLASLLILGASSLAPSKSSLRPRPTAGRPPPLLADRGGDGRPTRDDSGDADGVSALERARILSYRAAIGASALLISSRAISDAGFLEGTGVDMDGLLEEQSTSALPLASGIALLLCPVPSNGISAGISLLGVVTVGSGLYSGVGGGEDAFPWTLAILSLMAISVREIWYFGGAYKVECGITLFMLPLMLDLNNPVPFASALCALGMVVLAGGKLFEPCLEDLKRSNSEFMAK